MSRIQVRWRVYGVVTTLFSGLLAAHTVNAQGSPSQAAPQVVPPPTPPQPAGWEQSIALESLGALAAAREAMVAAYGPRPAVYAPCVRLAWLSWRLGMVEEALRLYARARGLDADQPEAPAGEALVRVAQGWAQVARGELPAARRNWEQVLATPQAPVSAREEARGGLQRIGYANEVAPELWGATIGATPGGSAASVLYVGVPVRVNAAHSLRVALRTVTGASARTADSAFFASQVELFVGGGVEVQNVAMEGVLFRLATQAAGRSGAGVSARLGGTQGLTLTGAAISTGRGSNLQLAPALFRWVTPRLSLSAGARLTSDSGVAMTSVLAGAAYRAPRVALELRGHAGRERWALDMGGPTLLSFLGATDAGGTGTLSVAVTPRLWVSAQGQAERLAPTAAGGGWYRSLAVGVRVVRADLAYGRRP